MEYPEIVAGLSKAGLIAVLVNPRSVSREVEYFIRHSGSKGAIIESSLVPLVENYIFETSVEQILTMDSDDFGLDYGCGYAPALADIFKKDGFNIDVYDPFFFPNQNIFLKKFKFSLESKSTFGVINIIDSKCLLTENQLAQLADYGIEYQVLK